MINYTCVFVAVFTPLGFVRLFGVVGGVLVKPQFLRDLNEEYYVYSFEEDTIRRRINNAVSTGNFQPYANTYRVGFLLAIIDSFVFIPGIKISKQWILITYLFASQGYLTPRRVCIEAALASYNTTCAA